MKKKKRRRFGRRKIKTLAILPNLLTTINLFAGFLSMVSTINGHFEKAGLFILLAIAFDSLDGRIARLTRTTSTFGKEYDSLSDLSSFGIAPSLLTYVYYFKDLGKWGIIPPFLYLTGVAMRLARFNIQSSGVEKYQFTGLPSPAGAGFLVSTFMFSLKFNLSQMSFLVPLTVLIALLMVSRIRFMGFKDFDLLKRLSFPFFFLLVAGTVFAIFEPIVFAFSLFSVYTLSGIVDYLIKKIIKKESVKEEKLEREDIHI